jgi:hypothetical protein
VLTVTAAAASSFLLRWIVSPKAIPGEMIFNRVFFRPFVHVWAPFSLYVYLPILLQVEAWGDLAHATAAHRTYMIRRFDSEHGRWRWIF